MTLLRRALYSALLLLAIISGLRAQDVEFNTLLFQTTFKIEGSSGPGTVSFGTGFFMAKPIPQNTKFRYVLITAKHVLDGIQADTATLNLRRKTNDGWQRVRYPIKIRDSGVPLWTGPDDVDVAVMYVTPPQNVQILIISTNLLADDDMLSQFEVNPGEELTCLGYPLAPNPTPQVLRFFAAAGSLRTRCCRLKRHIRFFSISKSCPATAAVRYISRRTTEPMLEECTPATPCISSLGS